MEKEGKENMNEILQKIVDGINAVDVAIWGWPMIILLLGTHIFMTICTGGIQRKSVRPSGCR